MGLTAVVQKITELGIVMLLGFIVVKTGYINANVKDGLSKIIVRLLLPCLVIYSISSKDFQAELLGNIGIVFAMSVFCILLMFTIGSVTAKVLKIPDYTKSVHRMMSTLGNAIFIGLPVVSAMYGEMGFFYAIIYWLLNDMFLWTVGMITLSNDKTEKKESFIKKLLNPNTLSFVVAIIMFFSGIKLPSFLGTALNGVGGLTTNLSMIFIGMTLATVDVKSILKKWWVFLIIPVKLIILPVIFILIFDSFGIEELLLGVVVIEAAMPTPTALPIVANELNSDYEYAAVGMFATTLVSLVTLPFVCYLLQTIV